MSITNLQAIVEAKESTPKLANEIIVLINNANYIIDTQLVDTKTKLEAEKVLVMADESFTSECIDEINAALTKINTALGL